MDKKTTELYKDDLDNFPDYQTYLENLEKLDKTDYSKMSYDEIYNLFYDLACIIPSRFGFFNPIKFNSNHYFRVRLRKDIGENEDLSLKQTFSYPPPSILHKNGRANLKYKTVFYCSNNPNTAILESKPEIGDEGYLSIWKGVATRKLKSSICLPYNLTDKNEWHFASKDSFEELKKTLPEKAKDKYNHVISLFKFVANKFVNEKEPYPLTSMISNELLYGRELWNDYILYPSILSDCKRCNIAFHPNIVNENLDLEKIIEFRFGVNSEKSVEFGKVGYYHENKLIWRKRNDDENYMFKIKKTSS